MLKDTLNKILKYRVHGFVSAIILVSVFLFSAYQVNVKATGNKTFVGTLSNKFSISDCRDDPPYYTCRRCSLCNCGLWDQYTIEPDFGKTTNSAFKLCRQAGYSPQGTGFKEGAIVFGTCPQEILTTWDATSCNLWGINK